MPAVEQNFAEEQLQSAATQQAEKTPRMRGKDNGTEVLSHMEHFVRLVRKVQRAELLRALVECANGSPLATVAALADAADGSLSIASRNAVFAAVAELQPSVQTAIERAAERVLLLCDEYGTLAVSEQLNEHDSDDAPILTAPTDKFSRALYLYLRQEFPVGTGVEDRRFDHSETRQEMLRQGQCEKYSSHYLGPKGIEPKLDVLTESTLRQRLSVLFPQVEPDDIIIERFERRDLSKPEQPIALYTMSATFNGSRVHYQQVANGEVEDHDEPAVTNVQYSWQPAKGALGVFCDDKEVRPELAALFRDVVLGGNGDIRSMPLREFNLMGFSTPAMLNRFKKDRIEGIEGITIQHIVVAKPEVRQAVVRGKVICRLVENALVIRRHRFEERDIYTTAKEVHGIEDLTGYVVQQVRLSIRIAKCAHRKAHNVSAQITAPNGFNDRSKTEDDSELVFAQLMRLDCARQY